MFTTSINVIYMKLYRTCCSLRKGYLGKIQSQYFDNPVEVLSNVKFLKTQKKSNDNPAKACNLKKQ